MEVIRWALPVAPKSKPRLRWVNGAWRQWDPLGTWKRWTPLDALIASAPPARGQIKTGSRNTIA